MKAVDYAELRLIQWGRAQRYPSDEGFNPYPEDNILQKVRMDRRNTAAWADPFRFEIIEDEDGSVAVRSDGGVGAMVDRMYRAIRRANMVSEVQECINRCPADHLAVIRAGYSPALGYWGIPRPERRAAEYLGVSREKWRERRAAMLAWLVMALCVSGRQDWAA